MTAKLGILAFGSLIDRPGWEIEEAIVARKTGIRTPFSIEFARTSRRRAGAPTLVPVKSGGSPVLGHILVVDLPEQEAKDRLWRRETNRVGKGGHYIERRNPGPDTLIIDPHENVGGVAVVLAARFAANIAPLNAEVLAALAIESAQKLDDGRDGISYLRDAKRNGIATPLSAPYEREILRRMQAVTLEDALKTIRACRPAVSACGHE
jgi:cation transport regulator ChaC